MSGAGTILGTISAIITLIDATKRIGDAATDAQGLPHAFREVNNKIPLVRATLKKCERHYSNTQVEGTQDDLAIKEQLTICEQDAEALKTIFEKVIPENEDGWLARYWAAVRTVKPGRSRKIEALMANIMSNLALLQSYHIFTNVATRPQLEDAVQELKRIEPSLPPSENTHVQTFGQGSNVAVGGSQKNFQGFNGGYAAETMNIHQVTLLQSDNIMPTLANHTSSLERKISTTQSIIEQSSEQLGKTLTLHSSQEASKIVRANSHNLEKVAHEQRQWHLQREHATATAHEDSLRALGAQLQQSLVLERDTIVETQRNMQAEFFTLLESQVPFWVARTLANQVQEDMNIHATEFRRASSQGLNAIPRDCTSGSLDSMQSSPAPRKYRRTTIISCTQRSLLVGTLEIWKIEIRHDPKHCLSVKPNKIFRVKFTFTPNTTLTYLRANRQVSIIMDQVNTDRFMTLRCARILPKNSRIFELCEAGDVNGVHQMLATKQAFVHDSYMDKVDRSWALLDIAAMCGHADLCKLLLDKHPQAFDDIMLSNAFNMATMDPDLEPTKNNQIDTLGVLISQLGGLADVVKLEIYRFDFGFDYDSLQWFGTQYLLDKERIDEQQSIDWRIDMILEDFFKILKRGSHNPTNIGALLRMFPTQTVQQALLNTLGFSARMSVTSSTPWCRYNYSTILLAVGSVNFVGVPEYSPDYNSRGESSATSPVRLIMRNIQAFLDLLHAIRKESFDLDAFVAAECALDLHDNWTEDAMKALICYTERFPARIFEMHNNCYAIFSQCHKCHCYLSPRDTWAFWDYVVTSIRDGEDPNELPSLEGQWYIDIEKDEWVEARETRICPFCKRDAERDKAACEVYEETAEKQIFEAHASMLC